MLTNWWCKSTSVAKSPAEMTRKHFVKRLQALRTAGEWNPSIDLSYTRKSALSYSMVSWRLALLPACVNTHARRDELQKKSAKAAWREAPWVNFHIPKK